MIHPQHLREKNAKCATSIATRAVLALSESSSDYVVVQNGTGPCNIAK